MTEQAGIAVAARRLAAQLRDRRAEIEEAIATRVYALADPAAVRDPEYREGLLASLTVGLDYSLATIELAGRQPGAAPTILLTQAHLAARHRVSLDIVLRRYFAAYSLVTAFIIEEAQRNDSLSLPDLRTILRNCAAVFDNLVEAVTEEYTREQGRAASAEERRAEHVRRLLAGELVDTSNLAYELDGWHVALIANGSALPALCRSMAAALDRHLLTIMTGELSCAAWLGGRHEYERDRLRDHLAANWPANIPVAFGEPGFGLAGWRLTHRQASAALPVVMRSKVTFAFYADVALHASAAHDDLLSTSLRQLYLDPLERERDAGALRETLRAYLRREQNISSAAAVLGVSRRTVANRLRRVETRLGQPLYAIAAELEVALRLHDLYTPSEKLTVASP